LLGSSKKASQGDAHFVADNPPFGAVFTYYLRDTYQTSAKQRQEAEKQLAGEDKVIPFPGWEELDKEIHEDSPKVWIVIKDLNGEVVRRIEGPVTKGFHRVAWDLQFPSTAALRSSDPRRQQRSPMVAPGTFTATLMKQIDGNFTRLSDPVNFDVVPLRSGALEGASPDETVAFWQEIQEFRRQTTAVSSALRKAIDKTELMRQALIRTRINPEELEQQLLNVRAQLLDLDRQLNGSRAKREVGEEDMPNVNSRLSTAIYGTSNSTYGPTPTHRRSLEIAKSQFADIREKLEHIRLNRIPELEKALQEAGAPWIEGQPIPEE
jgi:hypothetical protein